MRARTLGIPAAVALVCLGLTGCDAEGGSSAAAGTGGAAPDGGGGDGAGGDVNEPVADAGSDSGSTGGGAPDGSPADAAQPDTAGSPADAATPDTAPDAAPDAGAEDTAEPDAASTPDAGPDTETPTGPPFYGVVQPILQEHCQLCHVSGGIGPFPLVTYENVAPLAPIIANAVADRHMPPWGQRDTEECQTLHPFADDISLSDDEIATILAWTDGGTPEGDPALALPQKEPIANSLPGVTQEIATPPYTVTGGKDIFRCFVLDPGFDEDTWVGGVHFVPSNDEVAHHALLFLDPDGASTALADETGGFDCFGGAPGEQLIAAWAPGGFPMQLPQGSGIPVQAGSKLVLQMHYHPTGLGDETDSTTIQLRTLDAEPALYAFTALIGNFNHSEPGGDGLQPGPADGGSTKFLIPAGATDHTESMAFTVPPSLDGSPMPYFAIHAVASHMHYVGVDMLIEVDRAAGGPPCTAEELAPLQGCLAEHCDGVALGELQDCAVSHCAGTVGGLSPGCTDCLVANVSAGSVDAIADACQQAPEPPPVTEQPAQECLLQTPRWDFHWQRFYVIDKPFDELPTLGPGDRLRFRCTYDNSLDNEHVAEALDYLGLEEPIDVHLGETTLDEMCLVALQLVYAPPSE